MPGMGWRKSRDIVYRPFTKPQSDELKATLGDIVTIANPLDYNTFIWGDWPNMTRMFEAALASCFDLAMLVNDYPRADRCDDTDWKCALNTFVAAVKQTGARAANVTSFAETMPEDVAAHLMGAGIAPLCGLDNAVIATAAAAFIGKSWDQPLPQPLLSTHRAMKHEEFERVVIDEHRSKAELVSAGLIVPNAVVITPSMELSKIPINPPYALKALGIAHKTEAGAVVLNLQSVDEVENALSSIRHFSDKFLLEEMAGKPVAELIVWDNPRPSLWTIAHHRSRRCTERASLRLRLTAVTRQRKRDTHGIGFT